MVHAGYAAALASVRVDPAHALRRAGLPGDLFARGTVPLATPDYHRLWRAIEDEAADPLLPLRLARTMTADTFDVPMFAALCSRDLRVAAERLATYKPLIGPTLVRVEHTGDATRIAVSWPDGPVPRALQTTELLWWVAFARLATRHSVEPLQVTSTDPPTDPAFADYLGAAIEAGPADTVSFSAADAARPFLTSNARMWDFFEPELRRRLSNTTSEAPMSERVHGALLELLPAGDPTMEGAARALGVSVRTLQRRLHAEGVTFQDRLNRTREALARHYLGRSQVPVAEIAFLLAYETPTSFYRGWTGSTPERYRATPSAPIAVEDP